MNNQEDRQKAKIKVEAKIGFGTHLAVYLAVNTLLIIINVITSTEYYWFIWPLMGWGIAVIFHAISVFNPLNSNLKERMIEKELQKQ